MAKKPQVEADLDPIGSRNPRPGSKIADEAIEDSKPAAKRKRPSGGPSRPGSTAAARAVDATRGKKR